MMLRLTFGATEVHVNTTSTLSHLLAATHRRHCSPVRATSSSHFRPRSVSVNLAPPDRSPEYALRDAQREIAGEVATAHGWHAVDAVVVERDGRALALIGASGSGKSTVAAHLLARRWKLVTDDVAFIDEGRGAVVGHHGLMRFRSGALPHLPAAFRATLERSRWFVDEDGQLQFYEVDPEAVFGAGIWSHEALLDAVVMLDEGANAHIVTGTSSEAAAFLAFDGTATLAELAGRLRTGVIGRDRAVRLADRIEHWYDAHVRS
jgi:hypothetical protein